MSQHEGYVKAIPTKTGNGKRGVWTLYSVALEGPDGTDRGRFGLGFDAPHFEVGQYIRFQSEKNAKGYDEMTKGTGAIVNNPPPRVTPAPSNSSVEGRTSNLTGGVAIRSADGYWQTKFDHEVKTVEPRITYASAREKALQLVTILLSADALPLTANKQKPGEGKRYDEIVEAVDILTAKFFHDSVDQSRVLGKYPASGAVVSGEFKDGAATPKAEIKAGAVQPDMDNGDDEDDINDDIPF